MNTNKQNGISLIEILIALLISSIIMIAVMGLYSGFYRSSKSHDALSHAQDNANFALNELSKQIRMAGSGLCANSKPDKTNMNPPFDQVNNNVYAQIPLLSNIANQLDSYNKVRLRVFQGGSGITAASLNTTLTVPANSDVLLLTYSLPQTLRVLDVNTGIDKDNRTFAQELATSKYHGLKLSSPLSTIIPPNSSNDPNASNRWLMISDCDYSEVAYYPQFSNAQLNNPNAILPPPSNMGSTPQFQRRYYHTGQTALVAPIESKLFFVAGNAGSFSLYERRLLDDNISQATQAIIDGVSNIQIESLDAFGAWQPLTVWGGDTPIRITLTINFDGTNRPFVRIIAPRN